MAIEEFLDGCDELLGMINMPPKPTAVVIRRAVLSLADDYPTLIEAINLAHEAGSSDGSPLDFQAGQMLKERHYSVKEVSVLNTVLDEVVSSGVRNRAPKPKPKPRSRKVKDDDEDDQEVPEPPTPPRPKPKAKPRAKTNKSAYAQYVIQMSKLGYDSFDIHNMWTALSRRGLTEEQHWECPEPPKPKPARPPPKPTPKQKTKAVVVGRTPTQPKVLPNVESDSEPETEVDTEPEPETVEQKPE